MVCDRANEFSSCVQIHIRGKRERVCCLTSFYGHTVQQLILMTLSTMCAKKCESRTKFRRESKTEQLSQAGFSVMDATYANIWLYFRHNVCRVPCAVHSDTFFFLFIIAFRTETRVSRLNKIGNRYHWTVIVNKIVLHSHMARNRWFYFI